MLSELYARVRALRELQNVTLVLRHMDQISNMDFDCEDTGSRSYITDVITKHLNPILAGRCGLTTGLHVSREDVNAKALADPIVG